MQRLRLVRASPRARRPASGTRRGVRRGEQLPHRVDGPAAVLPARVALPLLGGKLELRRIQRRRRRTPQLPRPGGRPALRADAGQPHGHLQDRLPLGARLLGDELDRRRLARSEGAVMTGTARAAERADTELTVFTGSRPSHVGDLQHLESAGILPVPESGRYGTARRMFATWLSPNLEISAVFIGALGPLLGLSAALSLTALGLGIVLGSLPVAWLPFGKGIVLPGIIQALSAIGWIAIGALFGAQAAHLLFRIPFWLAAVLVVAATMAISIRGYEAALQA